MEEDSYNPAQAAKVLGVSDRRVRQLLEAGDLEGEQDDSGRWSTPQRAVHAMLEARGSPRGSSAGRRRPNAPDGEDVGAPRGPAGRGQAEDAAENVRDLVSRVEDLSYRLGASQARLELTERAESTLREERDRLARELEEERAERRRLADRLERLERTEPAEPIEAEGDVDPGQQIPTATSAEEIPADPALERERAPWWKRIFR